MARAEKQRDKAARRLQRKEGDHTPEPDVTLEEAAILRGFEVPPPQGSPTPTPE
jgi:hypothetical protein